MPRIMIRRTALLLVAVMAMLPLQAVQGSLVGAGTHASHMLRQVAHRDDHETPAMAAMPGCHMHQGDADEASAMPCDGGCRLCGACAAAVLSVVRCPGPAPADHPSPLVEHRPLPQPAYALFRPPRP